MIKLNNKKFAENEKEFLDSLFISHETCIGYAKRLKKQVKLYDHQRKLIGCINQNGVLCHATKHDKGHWYSYATIPEIGEYQSYQQKMEECKNIINNI